MQTSSRFRARKRYRSIPVRSKTPACRASVARMALRLEAVVGTGLPVSGAGGVVCKAEALPLKFGIRGEANDAGPDRCSAMAIGDVLIIDVGLKFEGLGWAPAAELGYAAGYEDALSLMRRSVLARKIDGAGASIGDQAERKFLRCRHREPF